MSPLQFSSSTFSVPPSRLRRSLEAASWIGVAALIHAGAYWGATEWASSHRGKPTPRPDVSEHIMVIPPPPTESPLPDKSEPISSKTPVTPSVTPSVAPIKPASIRKSKIPRQQRAKAPPASTTASNEPAPTSREQAFKDIGRMGSVDIGATGPGGGSFTVAVGTSGVGGPIGRTGRIEGIASLRGHGEVPGSPPPTDRRSRPVSIRDLSRKAKPVARHNRTIKAPYPEALQKEAVTGEVQAVLIVRSDGTVGEVDILKSTHDAFARSAIRALMQFLFEPALDKKGRAVTSKVKLTYRFTLE